MKRQRRQAEPGLRTKLGTLVAASVMGGLVSLSILYFTGAPESQEAAERMDNAHPSGSVSVTLKEPPHDQPVGYGGNTVPKQQAIGWPSSNTAALADDRNVRWAAKKVAPEAKTPAPVKENEEPPGVEVLPVESSGSPKPVVEAEAKLRAGESAKAVAPEDKAVAEQRVGGSAKPAGAAPEGAGEARTEENAKPLPFRQWVAHLWPDAAARGISRATFNRLLGDIEPDYRIPDLVLSSERPLSSGQAEFIKTPASYLDEGSLQRLARQGREKAEEHQHLLDAIERKSGVSKYAVLAIWGREGGFGTYKFPYNAIRVLATQAFVGRRKTQFREELLIALSLVERRIVKPENMNASWAGAMGQTQFMPSDYDKYALSFEGSGPPDPWSSLPDALASAANQLHLNGWLHDLPWGFEARGDSKIDCTLATPELIQSVEEWKKRGVVLHASGMPKSVPGETKVSLLMPAGTYGPFFLVTQNFYALKAYNQSELYALFVGDLSDRIAGRGGFRKRWGDIVLLHSSEVEELQEQLKAKGFYSDKIDGKAGSRTRAAVGLYQKSRALKTDCWPTKETLSHIRTSYN